MKKLLIFGLAIIVQTGLAQVKLSADGPGNTYELITSVLAPNYNPIEVPDCNHEEFGDHIDEVFDNDLNKHVFRFHIHTEPDNDRCINFDRQRNEIKSYDQSPDNLLGVEGEKVAYKWKFKLPLGYQVSSKFCHIHQLKSVGGDLASQPMYTLTTRKGTPDRFQLLYAKTDDSDLLLETDLAPFIDTWVEVSEVITYGVSGKYQIEIKRVSDQQTLFEYSNESIINWRPNAEFVRPKWGIYRSLVFAEDLRDEEVLFADFSIEELSTTSSEDLQAQNELEIYFSNPTKDFIHISDPSKKIRTIKIFGLNGTKVIDEAFKSESELTLDVSLLAKGVYVLNFIGNQLNHSELVLIE